MLVKEFNRIFRVLQSIKDKETITFDTSKIGDHIQRVVK